MIVASIFFISLGTGGMAFGVQDFFGFEISYGVFMVSVFISSFFMASINDAGYVLGKKNF